MSATLQPEDPAMQMAARIAEHARSIHEPGQWTELLGVAARWPRADTAVAIHAQRPGATVLATATGWRTVRRHVRQGERGLLLPSIRTGEPTEVYDLTQTSGLPPAAPVPLAPAVVGRTLVDLAASWGYQRVWEDAPAGGGPARSEQDVTQRVLRLHTGETPEQSVLRLIHHLVSVRVSDVGPDTADVGSVTWLVAVRAGLDPAEPPGVRPEGPPANVRAGLEEVLAVAGPLLDAVQAAHAVRHQASRTAARDLARVARQAQLTAAVASGTVPAASPVVAAPAPPSATPEPAPQPRPVRTTAASAPSGWAGQNVSVERLREVQAAAVVFFRSQLLGEGGTAAREYLTGRGLTGQVLPHVLHSESRWVIGYAPPAWSMLREYLSAQGFNPAELAASGLMTPSPRSGELGSLFRNRIMIGVRDLDGHVVGWIGRDISGQAPDGMKYLNSPQTALYHKGELLLGLYEGREALARGAVPVVVEGAMDLLAASIITGQVPVTPSGTAFTAGHAAALRHAAGRGPAEPRRRALLAFDADAGGRQGAVAAYELLRDDWQVWVPQLPEGADPAQVLQTGGVPALAAVLLHGQDMRLMAEVAIDHHVASYAAGLAAGHAQAQVDAVRTVLPILAAEADHIASLTAYAAQATGVNPQEVVQLLVDEQISPDVPAGPPPVPVLPASAASSDIPVTAGDPQDVEPAAVLPPPPSGGPPDPDPGLEQPAADDQSSASPDQTPADPVASSPPAQKTTATAGAPRGGSPLSAAFPGPPQPGTATTAAPLPTRPATTATPARSPSR